MLNPTAKLNKHIFDKDVEQVPLRNGYGTGVVKAGRADENVVVLCADLTASTRSADFEKEFPDRFIEMGVAEQNLVTVAAGMGISGKIAFITSYATFSPGRNWEQIRTTCAYNDSNVKIVGSHAGISVGPDGATHQAIEDIATMRVIPKMKVFVPCDVYEAERATLAAAKLYGPVYIRLAREKTPVITTEHTPFNPGKAQVFWRPAKTKKPDVAIIGCGPLLYQALVAAKELEEDGVSSIVLNVPTVKPIDERKIVEVAEKAGAVVTIEEHQVLGGLGGAVAEVLGRKQPTPMEFIGMQDTFGESGPPNELLERYGMGVKDVKAAAKKAISRKR
jgi:transketolase